MEYYFTKERDITDIETLVEIGEKVGLPKVDKFLETDEFSDEIAELLKHTRGSLRVTGVPTFFIANNKGRQTKFSGGQPSSTFLSYFIRLGIQIPEETLDELSNL